MPVRELHHARADRHRHALDELAVGLRARGGGHDRAAVQALCFGYIAEVTEREHGDRNGPQDV